MHSRRQLAVATSIRAKSMNNGSGCRGSVVVNCKRVAKTRCPVATPAKMDPPPIVRISKCMIRHLCHVTISYHLGMGSQPALEAKMWIISAWRLEEPTVAKPKQPVPFRALRILRAPRGGLSAIPHRRRAKKAAAVAHAPSTACVLALRDSQISRGPPSKSLSLRGGGKPKRGENP